jgi:hypothetical protein
VVANNYFFLAGHAKKLRKKLFSDKLMSSPFTAASKQVFALLIASEASD